MKEIITGEKCIDILATIYPECEGANKVSLVFTMEEPKFLLLKIDGKTSKLPVDNETHATIKEAFNLPPHKIHLSITAERGAVATVLAEFYLCV